jgi:hypothetical protein
MTEQSWWVYKLASGATIYVPADTEEAARRDLNALRYKGAPDNVELVCSMRATREAIVKSCHGGPIPA